MASPCEVIWPKVYLVGDSITERSFSYDGCFGSDLANSLIRKCDVINRGFSGYNTRWVKIAFPRLIPAREVDNIHLVIIMLGTNDSSLPGAATAVPLDEYKTNLVTMLDYLMAIGVKRDKIMLMDPPAVDPDHHARCIDQQEGEYTILKAEPWDVSQHTIAYTREFAHAAVDIAKKWRVGNINLFESMMAQPNWKDMLIDGYHFTNLGASFLFKLLWPWVDARTKDLPERLPLAVDTNDPEKSLTQGGNP